MGADGHVFLYDGEAIIKDGKKEDFFKYFGEYKTYDQGTFLGKQIFTTYAENGTDKFDLSDDHEGTVEWEPSKGAFNEYLLARWEVWT